MNKYLEKIAEEVKKNEKPGVIRTGAEAGIGYHLGKKLPSHLLGYHTVYHGTAKEHGEKIRKEGFDPKRGGTGAASHHGADNFVENSKGKVHVTKSRIQSRMFAGFTQHGVDNPGKVTGDVHTDMMDKITRRTKATQQGMKNIFTGQHGDVIKARISDHAWNKDFTPDPDMGNVKDRAATTEKHIGVGSIDKKRSAFATKKNLKNYYGSASGRLRALKGVGYGVAGAGLIAHAIKGRMDKNDK